MSNPLSPRLVFAVTTDLCFDQRMQRICGSLAAAGYQVQLVGWQRPGSPPLLLQPYAQHRLRGWFQKGKLFYLEYNLRLLLYLLGQRAAAWCACDLDTALPIWLRARLGGQPLVYDAHELFTEVPEVVARPAVQRLWRAVEAFVVPRARLAYTVGPALARVFAERYGRPFGVVRNVSRFEGAPAAPDAGSYILYQGALNVGRGLEQLLDAMPQVRGRLVLCGEGDLSAALRAQATRLGLLESGSYPEGQVEFRGFVLPDALREVTRQAALGLNLLENTGLSYYYSLANKFFDYVHAGIPQVLIDFPSTAPSTTSSTWPTWWPTCTPPPWPPPSTACCPAATLPATRPSPPTVAGPPPCSAGSTRNGSCSGSGPGWYRCRPRRSNQRMNLERIRSWCIGCRDAYLRLVTERNR